MNLKWSLYLGKLFGIRLYIHWTFWILILWIFLMHYRAGENLYEATVGVLFILALFACVVLHELGHALTARRFHIQTRNITLLPIGGVANLERMPEKPGQEFLVAIAGPLVNVIIAVLLLSYMQFTGTLETAARLALTNAETYSMTKENFVLNLMAVNIMLVLFNMIPAFPMDGGRVLRALLSYRLGRAKATAIAATIGQLLAIVFVFFGFFYNFWLVFIGLFIFLGAGGEASLEAAKTSLSGYTVKDVLMVRFSWLSPNDTLAKAVGLLLEGQEQSFLVGDGTRVQGILTRKDIIRGLNEFGKDAFVSQVMQKNFITLHPDMPLQEVFHNMLSNGHTFVPVLDDQGHLVGVLDRENISEFLWIRSATQKKGQADFPLQKAALSSSRYFS
ncbi:MAG: protease [Chitinophagales bacterium]|nr:MAG: protease [Chitinophagales bacterium]